MAATVEDISAYSHYRGAKHIITKALEYHKALPELSTEELLSLTLEAVEKARPACADKLEAT